MDAIVELSSEPIKEVLQRWDTVDTVTVLKFGTDRYDPSFFVSFDVYYHGAVPDPDQREADFGFANAFEATVDGRKDRFLMDDIPVRLEYKAIREVDTQVAAAANAEEAESSGTTYGFFRLTESEIIMNRSNWLPVVRRILDELPEEFWVRRIETLRAHMEHALSDLTSAVYAEENLFYELSLGRFLETSCGLMFALNRRFDPPGRILRAQIDELPRLPEEFESRFEHLLRHDSAIPGSRKRQIAELLARSLLRLS
jgi:hypothetical protein